MKKPDTNKVEVDMVPLIDIISLVLMFLIIVGDTAAGAASIQMKLPRADQALTEKQLAEKGMKFEGRIVVQLQSTPDGYQAVINNKAYKLVSGGNNKTLQDYLQGQIDWAVAKGYATKGPDGSISSPVKLRIPELTPMKDAELAIMTLARVGLVNVEYAADPVR